ncbi:MAG: TIGR03619 family F420-dependent LLM class oxidoreductase [Acidimicrobiales bacterium]
MQPWQNLGFTAPERLLELARAAEEAGMYGVSLPEHLVTPTTIVTPNPYVAGGGSGYAPDTPFIDPFVAFGALSAVTTRLHFLANVYVLPLRPLFVAAKSISSAAVLSNDRVVVGVGIGWLREEFEAAGVRFTDRGARTDEMLALLRDLLTGAPVAADTRHHQFGEVRIAPVPARPVPILVGGISDAALRRAARSDGWIGVNFDEQTLLPILKRLLAAREDAEREGAATRDRPFAVVVSRPPEFDRALAERYAHAGVTAMVNRPTAFSVGALASRDEHLAAMREFVDVVTHL